MFGPPAGNGGTQVKTEGAACRLGRYSSALLFVLGWSSIDDQPPDRHAHPRLKTEGCAIPVRGCCATLSSRRSSEAGVVVTCGRGREMVEV